MTQTTDIREKRTQRLYDLKDAAEYLGRTVWGVRNLVWAGELPVDTQLEIDED
jgi:hypothetical protein